jgi:hypothetical protein
LFSAFGGEMDLSPKKDCGREIANSYGRESKNRTGSGTAKLHGIPAKTALFTGIWHKLFFIMGLW